MKISKHKPTIGIIMVLLLHLQPVIGQEIKLPDTPVGKMAKAYFEAFRSEDTNAMREFTLNNRTKAALERVSIDDRMAQFKQIKGMIQQLEPRQVLKSEDGHLALLVYSEPIQSWFEVAFTLNDGSPPLLESFALKPSTESADKPEDQGFGEWKDLAGLLNNAIDKHGIPGISMAMIQDGKIVEVTVAGVRQIDVKDPIQVNDRFHIGSITKSMTATLIGKLIEEGKLKLSTTLRDIFPKMKMLEAYESVTVEQLLTHTAGLPGYLTVSDEEEATLLALPGNPSQQRLAFAKLVLMQEPATNPGTAFAYSNAGYALLGTITEEVTGKSWKQQLEKVIFQPLNMKTAGTDWPKTAERMDQPAGHFGALNDLTPQRIDEYPLGAYIEPAGDVHASMQDLARYALAHLKGLRGEDGILKSETFKMLHTVKDNRNYAAGWFVNTLDGKAVHEHPGSAGSFMALMMIEPEANRGVVIAANAGGLVLDGVFRKIIEVYQAK